MFSTLSCSRCGGPARVWLTSRIKETFCGYQCRRGWQRGGAERKKKKAQTLKTNRNAKQAKRAARRRTRAGVRADKLRAPKPAVIVRKSAPAKPLVVTASFYQTDGWRELRYRVLKKFERRCLVCGNGPKQGAVLHVDHIKPVSLYPELRLSEENLQVLCADCNLGKSNRDEIDWREK